MNHTLSIIIAMLLLAACRPNPADLQGTWKIDSITTFYNGFTMTTVAAGDEPIQHYEPEGRLRMTKGTEFRYFLYELHSDTLIHLTTEHKRIETFTIVKLDQSRLVLQMEKKPLFKEKNQRRYETRFFSRVE